ncbi:hypothetical protein [Streptomyces sp. NPDC058964]|uniref:hypothetical protein n=1 Tax=Streptomyces sp. NPDC058964 TaxID=3346681 RepID=UPI0036A8CD04
MRFAYIDDGAGLVEDEDGATAARHVPVLRNFLNAMAGTALTVDDVWGPATVKALQDTLERGRF